MEFILGAIAVIFCIAMVLQGRIFSVLIGGFIGSFFGVAGFCGAVVGAIIGLTLSKGKSSSDTEPHP